MAKYHRYRVRGGTYFFTVNLAQRRGNDLLVRHVDVLREAVRKTMVRHPFHIDAWVVLPDHVHAVWTLPEGDDDFSNRWRVIKQHFSRALRRRDGTGGRRVGERGIWQRRYWEHAIRDDEDFAAHVDYVHINPLKHGYVQRVVDWPYSSFHRWARDGIYPPDWADEPTMGFGTGERGDG